MTRTAGAVRVPGAELYYEARGSGPLVLLIHPSGRDADCFAELAGHLEGRYRVVAYDRRGHGRSRMSDSGASPPVDEHADDAVRLLDAMGVTASHVFGSSAGAVVALDLVTRYPAKVGVVIAHEPPAVSVLPDADTLHTSFGRVHDIHRASGPASAADAFLAVVGAVNPPVEARARLAAELAAGLARELLTVTGYRPDIEALRRQSARLVLGAGEANPRSLGHRVVEALAQRVGTSPIRFPGDHWGYASHRGPGSPSSFARLVDRVVSSESSATKVAGHEP
jgi:pimeloyl-ACP methyl ester carboxylesterase